MKNFETATKLQYLPNTFKGSAATWLYEHNAERITLQTVLDTMLHQENCLHRNQIEIVFVLLDFVRWVNSAAPPFKLDHLHGKRIDGSSPKEQTEESLRGEVHKYPKEFVFHPVALTEYHSVHRAELVKILIGILAKNGINAIVDTSYIPQIGIANAKIKSS